MTTTEADWQATLDAAAPADRAGLMQIFADWLDEMGDARGPGYRAMGKRAKRPQLTIMNEGVAEALHDTQWVWGRRDNLFATDPEYGANVDRACLLPKRWFLAIQMTDRFYSFNVDKEDRDWEHFPTRCQADDACALAFARLPLHRQRSLLTVPA